MAGPSFNPNDFPQGEFSPLSSLLRDAMRELGESSPDLFISLQQKRLINYANRVVNDVNAHPQFMDLLHNAWDPVSGCSITAGSNVLTVPSSAGLSLGTYSPIKIAGAGSGGGDLRTFVLNNDNGTVKLADEADTTVVSATVGPLYSARLKLYVSVTDVRAIDDQTIIEGIKHYFANDDGTNQLSMQVKSTSYYARLNMWMATLTNNTGDLTIPLRDEDDF